jgi:predicted membrane-bound spermidine synthase
MRLQMKRRTRLERNLTKCVAVPFFVAILLIFLAGCESIFGPKTEESSDEDTDTSEARIIVTNNYGEALDIYMDGNFQFLLDNGSDKKIRDVSFDEHEMEAKLPGTGTSVDSATIDVTQYTDYYYTIDDAPDINVINNYGVTLKIYLDGSYQFDLVDEEDRWIMNVSMGEHFLKAVKTSDLKEVASTTIDVSENKDYTWDIT